MLQKEVSNYFLKNISFPILDEFYKYLYFTGQIEDVKRLIKCGAEANSKSLLMIDPSIPLHFAAEGGNPEVVEFLINNGSAIDARDMCDWTPLHKASRNGHLKVVQLLVQNGAELDAKTLHSRTPIDIASENGHRDIVNLLAKEMIEKDSSNDIDDLHPLNQYRGNNEQLTCCIS